MRPIISDQEDEWMIGTKGRDDFDTGGFNGDCRRRRCFRTFLVHVHKCLVDDRLDEQLLLGADP